MEVFFSAWSENPKLLKLLCFKPGVGQNTALPRLLTAVLSFLVYITCRYHVLFNDTDIDINKHSGCIHGMDVELWQYCFTCIHPFKLKVTLQAHCTHTHTHTKKPHIDFVTYSIQLQWTIYPLFIHWIRTLNFYVFCCFMEVCVPWHPGGLGGQGHSCDCVVVIPTIRRWRWWAGVFQQHSPHRWWFPSFTVSLFCLPLLELIKLHSFCYILLCGFSTRTYDVGSRLKHIYVLFVCFMRESVNWLQIQRASERERDGKSWCHWYITSEVEREIDRLNVIT